MPIKPQKLRVAFIQVYLCFIVLLLLVWGSSHIMQAKEYFACSTARRHVVLISSWRGQWGICCSWINTPSWTYAAWRHARSSEFPSAPSYHDSYYVDPTGHAQEPTTIHAIPRSRERQGFFHPLPSFYFFNLIGLHFEYCNGWNDMYGPDPPLGGNLSISGAYWQIVLLLLMPPGIAAARRRRRHHKRNASLLANRCSHCHYDLTAHAPGTNCPECGTTVPAPAA